MTPVSNRCGNFRLGSQIRTVRQDLCVRYLVQTVRAVVGYFRKGLVSIIAVLILDGGIGLQQPVYQRRFGVVAGTTADIATLHARLGAIIVWIREYTPVEGEFHVDWTKPWISHVLEHRWKHRDVQSTQ